VTLLETPIGSSQPGTSLGATNPAELPRCSLTDHLISQMMGARVTCNADSQRFRGSSLATALLEVVRNRAPSICQDPSERVLAPILETAPTR
jgi:hypothetical protein